MSKKKSPQSSSPIFLLLSNHSRRSLHKPQIPFSSANISFFGEMQDLLRELPPRPWRLFRLPNSHPRDAKRLLLEKFRHLTTKTSRSHTWILMCFFLQTSPKILQRTSTNMLQRSTEAHYKRSPNTLRVPPKHAASTLRTRYGYLKTLQVPKTLCWYHRNTMRTANGLQTCCGYI